MGNIILQPRHPVGLQRKQHGIPFLPSRPQMKIPCVYIMANRPRGVTYIGVTAFPLQRIHQHRTGAVPGFTQRYRLHRLVHIEAHPDLPTAIADEKKLKDLHRDRKFAIIGRHNPDWDDLFPLLTGEQENTEWMQRFMAGHQG